MILAAILIAIAIILAFVGGAIAGAQLMSNHWDKQVGVHVKALNEAMKARV